MKKWLSYLLLSALLLTALPFSMARAEEAAGSGTLTANGNQINVSLSVPQSAEENITSLRFRLEVSASSGTMEEPVFLFADTVQSEVKDSRVIKNNDSYIVDVVLSGKKDQIIFPAGGQAVIGTVSIKPTGSVYKISTKFTGKTDENPVMEYVTDSGQSVKEVPLANTGTITIEKNAQGQIFPSGGGGTPTVTKEPDAQASPSAAPADTMAPADTAAPTDTAVPDGKETPSPSPSAVPGTTEKPDSFDKEKKPSLSVKAGKGSRVVTFQWNAVRGADGYIIYGASGKSGSYKRIKTLVKPETTVCKVTMEYASGYSFRMRAYQSSVSGKKIYGQYSQVKKLTTPPDRVKGMKVTLSKKGIKLSWKKVKNAEGYQIYTGKKKNGRYTLIKTLKKGSAVKTVLKKGIKIKIRYLKVRAYVNDASKKHIYGNYSKIIKAG